MAITRSRRTFFLAMSCVVAMTPLCASPVRAQNVAVTVNRGSITEDEIEQRNRLDFMGTHKRLTRQEVISELADDKDKIKEAEKFGVDLASGKVDEAYAQMCSRMRVAPEQLKTSLEGQGVRLDTLKNRIKADIARASLIRLRYWKYSSPKEVSIWRY